MRVNPINVNNNQNRNQHPNFGMKLVNNDALKGVIKFLKSEGMSKKEAQNLFNSLDKQLDDKYTVEFMNIKLNNNLFNTITGKVSDAKYSTNFEISHLAEVNSILKEANRSSFLLNSFVTALLGAKNTLADLSRPAKAIYNEAIQQIFGK